MEAASGRERGERGIDQIGKKEGERQQTGRQTESPTLQTCQYKLHHIQNYLSNNL